MRITVKKLFKSFLSFKSQNQYLLSAAGQAGAAAGASRRALSRAARFGDTKAGGEGNSCGVHFLEGARGMAVLFTSDSDEKFDWV